MEKRFLGNLGGKKIHALDYVDGRCKIGNIKQDNQVLFYTLEEGLQFPSTDSPALRKCGICIPKYEKEQKGRK